MRIILIVVTLLVLVACGQSSPSGNPLSANRSITKASLDQPTVPVPVPVPEKAPFTATISAPIQLKSNEEFIAEATLKNVSDDRLTILHAARVFYFKITKEGKGVNTFVMEYVGKVRPLPGQGTITEQYVYKLEQPGIYEVSAIARFTVGTGDHPYEIETSKARFEVLPLE